VTISVGVASVAEVPTAASAFSRDEARGMPILSGAGTLVAAADHALYRAKMGGRNRAVAADIESAKQAAA